MPSRGRRIARHFKAPDDSGERSNADAACTGRRQGESASTSMIKEEEERAKVNTTAGGRIGEIKAEDFGDATAP